MAPEVVVVLEEGWGGVLSQVTFVTPMRAMLTGRHRREYPHEFGINPFILLKRVTMYFFLFIFFCFLIFNYTHQSVKRSFP